MHGDKHGGVGVFFGDQADGAIADRQVVGQVDFFESGIFADQLDREGAGLALARDLRRSIARGPAVVVAGDSLQHVEARLGRQECVVAPFFGECAGQARVIGMRYQPPTGFRFQPQHRGLL